MQSLSNYNYRPGSAFGWISYADQVRQQPPPGRAADLLPAAVPNHESPSPSHGQISDPALDGCAAAA